MFVIYQPAKLQEEESFLNPKMYTFVATHRDEAHRERCPAEERRENLRRAIKHSLCNAHTEKRNYGFSQISSVIERRKA